MNKRNIIQSESVRMRVSKTFQNKLKQVAAKKNKNVSKYLKELVERDYEKEFG